MKSTSSLKVCVIGCGSFGRKRIQSLMGLPQWDCLGLYDIDFDRAQITAKQFGLIAFEKIDDLLNQPNLEVAIICTPNASHFELCQLCLKHNLYVLCEKPLFIKPSEYTNFLTIPANLRQRLKMGSNLAHFPCLQKLRQVLINKTYGDVKKIFASIGHNGEKIVGKWNAQIELSGGGAMLDNGIHLLTFFQQIDPSIYKIRSSSWKFNRHSEVEDYARGDYDLGGIELTIEASWCKTEGYCEFFLQTDRGQLYIDAAQDQIYFKLNSQTTIQEIHLPDGRPAIDHELIQFAHSIRESSPLHPSFEDARQLFTLIQDHQQNDLNEILQ